MPTTEATEAEYLVGLCAELARLRLVDRGEVLKLPPKEKARLAELELEVRERGRRMGYSVRRQVNAVLVPLGYPEFQKGSGAWDWETKANE